MYKMKPVKLQYDVIKKCSNFGEALDTLIKLNEEAPDRYGMRIGTWVEGIVIRIKNNEGSEMNCNYLYKDCAGAKYPWIPNASALFDSFWEIVYILENQYDNVLDKETMEKMAASMNGKNIVLDNKKFNCNDCKNNTKNDDDKCSPNCAKKCLNECNKVKEKKENVNTTKAVVIKCDDIKDLFYTFDEIIKSIIG